MTTPQLKRLVLLVLSKSTVIGSRIKNHPWEDRWPTLYFRDRGRSNRRYRKTIWGFSFIRYQSERGGKSFNFWQLVLPK